MKTLAITGFACPAERWKSFLSPFPNVDVVSFRQQLEGAENRRDLRSLGRFVAKRIALEKPELLIAHDFGVPTLVMGLLRVRRENPGYSPKVVLFNSALRGLNLLKTTHPFRIQVMSWISIKNLIVESGGECDPGLERYLSDIKAIYRQVILKALADQGSALFGKDKSSQVDLGPSVFIFRSDTDPYFPGETVQKMAEDIANSQVIHLDYGHFPYLEPIEKYARLSFY